MAKTAVIVVVVAFCAFVADASDPPEHFRICQQEGFLKSGSPYCLDIEKVKPGCNNVNKNWNDLTKSVDTFGRCMVLYEHVNCRGRKIRVKPGSSCKRDCKTPQFLSKCGFAFVMSSYMPC